MAMPGWQDGMPVLQPPPIPPRRRSPVDPAPLVPTDGGGQGSGSIPPIPPRRTSAALDVQAASTGDGCGARPALTKTNSLYTKDSVLMGFEPDQPPRPYSVEVPGMTSDFMVELADIDFTGSPQRNHSSSLEDLVPKPAEQAYPDISGAFRELRSTTTTPPVYPVQGNYGGVNSTLPNPAMGGVGGYGWNSALFDTYSSPAFGASSNVGPTSGTNCVPGAPQPSLGAFPGNGNFHGINGSSPAFPAAGNGGAGFYGNGMGFSGMGYPGNPFQSSNCGAGMGSGQAVGNHFLSLGCGMPKAASWGNMLELNAAGGQGLAADGGTFQSDQPLQEAAAEFNENMDLIEFRAGLPEHEYLSLDFFDPLYERGRKESVSVQDKGQNYSFGEAFPSLMDDKRPPPELRRHIRRESHEIWGVSTSQNRDSVKSGGAASHGPIGFEAVTVEQMFGSSDEDFLQTHQPVAVQSTAVPKSSRPPRPPPPSIEKKEQVRAVRWKRNHQSPHYKVI